VAHTLTPAQRNGGLISHPVVWYYQVQFVATGLLATVTLALWAIAAVVTVRRMEWPRSALAAEGVLASTVAVLMLVVTVAASLWWGTTASVEPWFLQGTRGGTAGSPFAPQLVGTMVVLALASAAALYGAGRVLRGRRLA
jgi:hypothetical protein